MSSKSRQKRVKTPQGTIVFRTIPRDHWSKRKKMRKLAKIQRRKNRGK